MLTRLRFKNWRSLKDVEIADLTPITVFIGANSSGKSNLLDALYFLREGITSDPFSELAKRGWEESVRTLGTADEDEIELQLGFDFGTENAFHLLYTLTEKSDSDPIEDVIMYWFEERLEDVAGTQWMHGNTGNASSAAALYPSGQTLKNEPNPDLALLTFGRMSAFPQIRQTFEFITQRWQLLDEGFAASIRAQSGSSPDRNLLDRCADNVPVILEIMQKRHPQIYSALFDDLSWLLGHVEKIETVKTEQETRFYLKEIFHPHQVAPTVSSGTARIIAVLTAYYALDMNNAEQSGLVVLEEPDTALNPGLLGRFVEQLRLYTEREGYPRQFILTTHNPHFLDFFQPEEVRVVERDEQGYTHVHKIPDTVSKIWLDEYGLGEVWTTNSFGGLPK